MTSAKDVPINDVIDNTALELRNFSELKAPEWSIMVKTGVHKDRPPVDKNWWHTRAAAVMVSVYNYGPLGVSKLRTKYAGKKNEGVKPEKFHKGSGSIIRKSLQQLEAAGLIKKSETTSHKGKIITDKGKKLLDTVASKIKPVAEKKVEEKKPEQKEAPKPALEKEVQEKKVPEVKKEEPKPEEKKE